MENDKEYCGNSKNYMLNGGKCCGVRSRHCEKYKKFAEKWKEVNENEIV